MQWRTLSRMAYGNAVKMGFKMFFIGYALQIYTTLSQFQIRNEDLLYLCACNCIFLQLMQCIALHQCSVAMLSAESLAFE